MLIVAGLLAVIMELIDSSLGMMYGTILSPVLILMGFDSKIVVPAILLSQGLGGLIAALNHGKFKSGDFSGWKTRDTKVVLSVVIPGLVACVIGALVALSVPKMFLVYYIGILVLIMGLICMFPFRFKFSWWKMYGIGLVSSFNKTMSGGGFGPITSTGKIVGGLESKASIATTTLAEVPICMVGFLIWYLKSGSINWSLPLYLTAGALVGGFFGPFITKKFNSKWLRIGVGALAVVSGILIFILRKTS